MANSVDTDQTAPFRSGLIWLCVVCICHIVRKLGVRNFRTFTIKKNEMAKHGLHVYCTAHIVNPNCAFSSENVPSNMCKMRNYPAHAQIIIRAFAFHSYTL